MRAPKRVLIIGGGFTGMVAAWQLSRQPGFAVTLLEKASELGGLAAGFELGGTHLEKTYHYLFTTDEHVLDLVKELGLQDKLIWADTSNAIYLHGQMYPFTTPLDVLRFSPCTLFGRIRLGLVVLQLQRRKNWRVLSNLPALDWMKRASGCVALDTVWGPLMRGKFGRYAGSISMAWLWARIHARANSRRNGHEQLVYVRGGFNTITQALAKELRRQGVQIRTGVTVETFSSAERSAVVDGQHIPFDCCIFTGPSPALANLLPGNDACQAFAQKLRSVEYLGAVCLVFTSEQVLGDYFWVNVNEPGAPFLVFLRHTRLVDSSLYQGRQVYYIGAYVPQDSPLLARSDDDIAAEWWAYLRKMFPAFDPKRVQERHVFKFRAAQHIVDTTYESRIPEYRTPLPGVFLANFSQVFPEDRGTNFAVREGRKIATLVAEELRHPSSP